MTDDTDRATTRDAMRSFVATVRVLAQAEHDRDTARAERDAALARLQAVREYAHSLGASTATRRQILDAIEREPRVQP